MKHKKAFLLEFFVRFVIALVFIGGAFYIGCSLFRLSSAAVDDYKKLVAAVNDNEFKSGEMKSIALSMDKETAIVFFDKEAKKEILDCYESIQTTQDWVTTIHWQLLLPKSSSECADQSCICLYRHLKKEYSKEGEINKIQFTGTALCSKTNVNYYLGENLISTGQYAQTPYRNCKGLVILERGALKETGEAEPTPRTRVIYLAKKIIGDKSLISICLDSDCKVKTEFEEAKALAGGGRYKEAIKKYEEFIKKYGKGDYVELAILTIGDIYNKKNPPDHENAKKYYQKLIDKFPNSQYVNQAKEAIEEISKRT